MNANRVTAVRLWMGAVVFGAIAILAWVRIVGLIPWELLTGSSGDGYVATNTVEVGVVLVLPLLGNLMVIGETRRSPLAITLRRFQWLSWAGSIVAAISMFLVPASAAFWIAALAVLLVTAQLTLLTAVFATLALDRTRAIA